MNSFIPENPRLVIGPNGETANNILRETAVVVCKTTEEFNEQALGMPFNSTVPAGPTQVHAMKKN
jgi:hypothetical protein